MAIDWLQCEAVERIPGKVSGAWLFRDSRLEVATVLENREDGATSEEVSEWFDISGEQMVTVLEFAARRLDVPAPSAERSPDMVDLG